MVIWPLKTLGAATLSLLPANIASCDDLAGDPADRLLGLLSPNCVSQFLFDVRPKFGCGVEECGVPEV
jgi:hypothetical protein